MIHRVHSTDLTEINRILELIQKAQLGIPHVSTSTVISGSASASGGGSGSVGVIGPQGLQGLAGADGTTANLLVGADEDMEVLFSPNGDVLTDENGYVLFGVRINSNILTGAGLTSIEVLNGA